VRDRDRIRFWNGDSNRLWNSNRNRMWYRDRYGTWDAYWIWSGYGHCDWMGDSYWVRFRDCHWIRLGYGYREVTVQCNRDRLRKSDWAGYPNILENRYSTSGLAITADEPGDRSA
jgi:hypothetical protein